MLQRARHLLIALSGLILLAVPAAFAASDTGYGTPASSTATLTLFEGPGVRYDAVGTIGEDLDVTVYRCSGLWCLVGDHQPRGWTALGNLDFGQPGRLNYAAGGPGEVCFYEGRNYTGPSLCLGSGRVFTDLLLYHLDNRFSSVSIQGDVSVAACRDRDFKSYCNRILASQPVLDKFLNDHVSAIRVY
ncbi:peptidase inhibitor family I36 protein [uncultured Devosia sp.]|uniref:peptidase inhibitor family I36 protein n=1 Tax=uncultured Devosia sp. TaxID=211434 RepID=UPI0035CBBD92